MSLSLSQHAVLLVVASAVGRVRTAFWRCTSRVRARVSMWDQPVSGECLRPTAIRAAPWQDWIHT